MCQGVLLWNGGGPFSITSSSQASLIIANGGLLNMTTPQTFTLAATTVVQSGGVLNVVVGTLAFNPASAALASSVFQPGSIIKTSAAGTLLLSACYASCCCVCFCVGAGCFLVDVCCCVVDCSPLGLCCVLCSVMDTRPSACHREHKCAKPRYFVAFASVLFFNFHLFFIRVFVFVLVFV